ncbi:hypothetical protein [Mycolicibacterium sphagni]|uniref:hypothetical protein n=1 Tax=Mycolicibacterium sphagni TaxID=1786 RepID=UPI0010544CE3|nr:hypothetical protein [Mycolicibacterium sphagni]
MGARHYGSCTHASNRPSHGGRRRAWVGRGRLRQGQLVDADEHFDFDIHVDLDFDIDHHERRGVSADGHTGLRLAAGEGI